MLVCGFVKAQLTTDVSLTPEQLVENVLVGSGVEVSNVTYVGASQAIGSFDGSSSNIGISNGIILSTGTVLDEVNGAGKKNGPVGPNNNAQAQTDWGRVGDTQLTDLINLQTFDAAVLEFDFIPQGDTIEFNYVFASEEYLEYSNSFIADVFAFFINGPGIVGQQNLAVVPGTGEEISINTINDINNSTLYIDNGSSIVVDGPQYSDPTITNFDGFTVRLKAIARVIPCQTYHLKIAIADGNDGEFDSGVFLEGGSLNSNPRFNIMQSDAVDVGTPALIPEGCSSGILEISREEDVWDALSIGYRVYGSAQNGIDYTLLNGTVDFVANDDKEIVEVQALSDALVEGTETVILRFPNPSVCESDSFDYQFNITDLLGMDSRLDSVDVSCPNEDVEISANFSGGYGPYTYSWDNGDNTIISSVAPNTTQTFEFTVEDVCGTSTTNDFKVKVPMFPALSLKMPNDTSILCSGLDVDFTPTASGGAGGYSYNWSSGENELDISPQILESENFKLTVTDQCGIQHTDSVYVFLDYPALTVDIQKDTIVCPGDTVEFIAIPSGGIPPYSYVWENFDTDSAAIFISNVSKIVNVSITDSCGIIPSKDSVRLDIQKPRAAFIYSDKLETGEPIYFLSNSTGDIVSFDWDLGNGEESDERNPTMVYDDDSTYKVTLSVTDSLGCKDSTFRELKILPPLYFWVPNAFTPSADGDDLNNTFLPKGIGIRTYELRIFNRWGEEIFYSDDLFKGWDGLTPAGTEAPIDAYVYKIHLEGENGREIDKMGSFSLIR